MSLEQELKEIAEQAADKNRVVSVDNFPDIQRVEVLNPTETAEITVDLSNVEEVLKSILSILKVEGKEIDLSRVENRLQGILEALSKEVEDKENVDYTDVLQSIKESIPASLDLDDFFERLEKTLEDKLDVSTSFKEAMKGYTSSGWLPVVQSLESGNAIVTIQGTRDNGSIKALNSTSEGHLEVAVHGPRLPFGSIHTENLTPVFQSDGVYGINAFSMLTSTGLSVGTGANSGSVTASNNKLIVATGTTQYSFASLQSRRRLRYRAGQGVVGRFAGFFTGAVANSILVAGFGTAETTLAFGYNGTNFGILYSTGGVRELHTFTVTTASTATDDYVVTLPNTTTVNVTATADCSGSMNTREDQ